MSGVKGKSGGLRKGAGAKRDILKKGTRILLSSRNEKLVMTVIRRNKNSAVLKDAVGNEWRLDGDQATGAVGAALR